MKTTTQLTISLALATVLAAVASADVAPPVGPSEAASRPSPALPKQPKLPRKTTAIPSEESEGSVPAASSGLGSLSVFARTEATAAPAGTLAAPVTVTYAGTGNAFSISDSGTGKGLISTMTNASGSGSAVYGTTVGAGAGVTGINSGTVGPAGKFEVTNPNSPQSAVYATTAGDGSAMLATITLPNTNTPAILGESTSSTDYGIGVEGEGNYLGVLGFSAGGDAVWGETTTGTGVYGSSTTGIGVYGFSADYIGLYAYSGSSYGTYSYSGSGYGVFAATSSGSAGLYAENYGGGRAIIATANSGIGVYASSATGYGVWGQSTNEFGVIGEDAGSGVGVYGSSATGYAGYFNGKVAATSYNTVSDRNAKTDFQPINGTEILDRVAALPVTSWDYKTDLTHRHLGPMAQDFHAAFGLNGDDDTHINLGDIAGVSIAAIKELNGQMKQKTEQLNARLDVVTRENQELKAQLLEQTKVLADMKSVAEVIKARMNVLEQQRDVAVQAAAFTVPMGARAGATE